MATAPRWTTYGVEDLVVFIHGLTASCTEIDPRHGKAIAQALTARTSSVALHYSTSNAGKTGVRSFLWEATAGIAQCGQLLAAEVAAVASRHHPRRISLVGASLGGLIARHAALLLFGGAGQPGMLPDCVRPHALITLATPHLGVRCLFGNPLRLALAKPIAQTVRELDWCDGNELSDPILLRMSRSPYLDVLQQFNVRVAFAPLINDGTVAYQTAALSTDRDIPLVDEQQWYGAVTGAAARFICKERRVGGDTSSERSQTYYAGDKLAGSMEQAVKGLHAVEWVVVDVAMDHKHLATLYPQAEGSIEVAERVLHAIIG